jgi:4-hydroxy-3-polyprenylbenzoate decarboxylase
MIVMPCSMKTLAGIANGFAENLLLRAADVCLKENRRVVLVPREIPLGRVHLRNMLSACELGCAIVPPMLTFYNGADSLQSQIDTVVGKVLMQFNIIPDNFKPWRGVEEN